MLAPHNQPLTCSVCHGARARGRVCAAMADYHVVVWRCRDGEELASLKSKALAKELAKANAEDPEGLAHEILQQRDAVEGPEPQHVGLGEGHAPWTTGEAAEELRSVEKHVKNGFSFAMPFSDQMYENDRLPRQARQGKCKGK